MAFYESPRFPERISRGSVGGPEFSTVVVKTTGGREQRDGQWQYPKQRWDVGQGASTPEQFAELRAFFLAMRGRLHGWRFKDWTDYQVSHAEGRVVGITSTTFQLFKRYALGAVFLDRKIVKPSTGLAIEVRVSGTVTAATVNTATGVVTIPSAPAAANVTWAGEFDVPMRFDSDSFPASVLGTNGAGPVFEVQQVPIIEVPA